MKDSSKDTSTLSMLIQRLESTQHLQQEYQQQRRPSPIKIPRLDLSVISQSADAVWSSSSASSSFRRGGAAWEAVVSNRNVRQAFLSLNSSLSPRHPPFSSCSNTAICEPTKIFDLTQPRKVPVPPTAVSSCEDAPSPLLKRSSRKVTLQQQQHTPRRFPIEVEGNGSAPSDSISDLHKEMAQRLLHIIMSPGVLPSELKKYGLRNGLDSTIAVTDVHRLAKRMFPSLHPSISCASVAPMMCGITGEIVKEEEVSVLLLAMVHSSFVADVLGRAEIVTKDALLQCIARLNIAQSAHPETCDGLHASALADPPGTHSSEMFCLWFVKLHMAIMLKNISGKDSTQASVRMLPSESHRREVLHLLRVHSNSAVEHLRAVNTSISSSNKEKKERKMLIPAGRSPARRTRNNSNTTSNDTDSRNATPFSPSRPTSSGVTSSSRDNEAERHATVNSARTCISANMHLVR